MISYLPISGLSSSRGEFLEIAEAVSAAAQLLFDDFIAMPISVIELSILSAIDFARAERQKKRDAR
jgi:hypothetical protein